MFYSWRAGSRLTTRYFPAVAIGFRAGPHPPRCHDDAECFHFFFFFFAEPIAAILSRCQRFDLHRIPANLIADHLQYIAGNEKVTLEPAINKLHQLNQLVQALPN